MNDQNQNAGTKSEQPVPGLAEGVHRGRCEPQAKLDFPALVEGQKSASAIVRAMGPGLALGYIVARLSFATCSGDDVLLRHLLRDDLGLELDEFCKRMGLGYPILKVCDCKWASRLLHLTTPIPVYGRHGGDEADRG